MIDFTQHPLWNILPGKLDQHFVNMFMKQGPESRVLPGFDPQAMTYEEYCGILVAKKFDLQYDPLSGIACMNVVGTLCAGASVLDEYFCEFYNTERIFSNMEEAARLEGLKALVILFDTPGGSTRAISEASAAIADAPFATVGWLSFCGSAGMSLAGGCDYLAAPPFACVGGMGTIQILPDLTKFWEMQGVEWKVFRDGIYKGMGDTRKPITPEESAYLQARVETASKEYKGWLHSRFPALTDEQMQGQAFNAKDIPALVGNVDHLMFSSFAESLMDMFQGA